MADMRKTSVVFGTDGWQVVGGERKVHPGRVEYLDRGPAPQLIAERATKGDVESYHNGTPDAAAWRAIKNVTFRPSESNAKSWVLHAELDIERAKGITLRWELPNSARSKAAPAVVLDAASFHSEDHRQAALSIATGAPAPNELSAGADCFRAGLKSAFSLFSAACAELAKLRQATRC